MPVTTYFIIGNLSVPSSWIALIAAFVLAYSAVRVPIWEKACGNHRGCVLLFSDCLEIEYTYSLILIRFFVHLLRLFISMVGLLVFTWGCRYCRKDFMGHEKGAA